MSKRVFSSFDLSWELVFVFIPADKHFQPANPQILSKPKIFVSVFVFCIFFLFNSLAEQNCRNRSEVPIFSFSINRNSPIVKSFPKFPVVMSTVWNLKVSLSSFENQRWIVRPLNVKNEQIQSNRQKWKKSWKRTVHQWFFNQNLIVFSFFAVAHNDRGYGHWRFAGAFTVAQATKWMRAQRPLNALQPPMCIGVC